MYPIEAEPDHPEPADETESGGDGDQRKPEPHASVNLLVEEVDRQHALHGVRVFASHAPQLEVAQRHAREPRFRRHRAPTGNDVTHEADAVEVVLGAEKQVENEQLDEQVQQVHCLCPTNTHAYLFTYLLIKIWQCVNDNGEL